MRKHGRHKAAKEKQHTKKNDPTPSSDNSSLHVRIPLSVAVIGSNTNETIPSLFMIHHEAEKPQAEKVFREKD
jgi:hypothetical protein